MKTKQAKAVHVVKTLVSVYGHKAEWKTERRDVQVMAQANGYAMVRKPRAFPYVCAILDLEFPKA